MKRPLIGIAALGGLLALSLGPSGGSLPATADDQAPTVSVTPTTGVTDGQALTVLVKTTSNAPVNEADVRLCRAGVIYQPSTDVRPAPDFQVNGPNCPGGSHRVSSSADYSVTDTNVQTNAPTPEGESLTFLAGTGTTTPWDDVVSP